MKSSRHLQREVSLRQEIDRLRNEVGDDPEGWDRYARRGNRGGLAAAQRELADISEDFEWTFDGTGVFDHGIAMNRLIELAEPLGQTLRWTARDLLQIEGGGENVTNTAELVEPLVTGMFAGSFGVRLSRPPIDEQLSMTQPTLFDRTVDRVLLILGATHDEEPEMAIFDALEGLRQTSLNGLEKLSRQLVEAGRSTHVRWRRDILLTVSPRDALLLAETIASAEPAEEDITIVAELRGGDIDGTVHLVEAVPNEPNRHYRGKTEPDATSALRGIALGSMVRATLLVVTLTSDVLSKTKETYVLRQITPLGQDILPEN